MPVEQLQELEAVPSIVDFAELEQQGSALNQLRVIYRHQVAAAVKGLAGSVDQFENSWQQIILEVAAGRTAEMQALRQRLLAAFQKHLDLLKRTSAFATELRKWHREESLPDPDVLQRDLAGLERLRINVFDHWQTAEDLEALALEHYPLSSAQLERVAATHAPPAEWYAPQSPPQHCRMRV
jgi:hypothetical protein